MIRRCSVSDLWMATSGISEDRDIAIERTHKYAIPI